MELDELKSAWLSLDERLRKQEILKENILREMLQTKVDKMINRMIGLEVIGLIVLILIIPVIFYALKLRTGFLEYSVFLYSMIVVCIIGIFWQGLKVYNLMQFDLSKVVSDNILHINCYNIRIKREKIAMLFFLPVVTLSIVYLYAKLNVPVLVWIFMSCSFAGVALYTSWAYKRLYSRNIKLIRESLDKLEELAEPGEK